MENTNHIQTGRRTVLLSLPVQIDGATYTVAPEVAAEIQRLRNERTELRHWCEAQAFEARSALDALGDWNIPKVETMLSTRAEVFCEVAKRIEETPHG